MNSKRIIEKFIRLIEQSLEQRSVGGYGASHPYSTNRGKRVYGKSDYQHSVEEENQEYEEETLAPKKKIKVSKHLKKGEDNEET